MITSSPANSEDFADEFKNYKKQKPQTTNTIEAPNNYINHLHNVFSTLCNWVYQVDTKFDKGVVHLHRQDSDFIRFKEETQKHQWDQDQLIVNLITKVVTLKAKLKITKKTHQLSATICHYQWKELKSRWQDSKIKVVLDWY